MASEITLQATGLSMEKGGVTSTLASVLKKFDMAGTNYIRRTFAVPTTAGGTALPLGSVVTPGWCLIVNTDATNYVQVLNAVGGTVCLKIKAGEFALFRFGATAPALIANAAQVTVEYLLVED